MKAGDIISRWKEDVRKREREEMMELSYREQGLLLKISLLVNVLLVISIII